MKLLKSKPPSEPPRQVNLQTLLEKFSPLVRHRIRDLLDRHSEVEGVMVMENMEPGRHEAARFMALPFGRGSEVESFDSLEQAGFRFEHSQTDWVGVCYVRKETQKDKHHA